MKELISNNKVRLSMAIESEPINVEAELFMPEDQKEEIDYKSDELERYLKYLNFFKYERLSAVVTIKERRARVFGRSGIEIDVKGNLSKILLEILKDQRFEKIKSKVKTASYYLLSFLKDQDYKQGDPTGIGWILKGLLINPVVRLKIKAEYKRTENKLTLELKTEKIKLFIDTEFNNNKIIIS